MYKQTLYGFRSNTVAAVFEIFIFLFYTSILEAVWKTEYSTFPVYLGVTLVFVLVSVYIFMASVTKYEYAVLDNELILRKFVRNKPQRIYSVKLTGANCIYCNKGIRVLMARAKETAHLYIPGIEIFRKKCAVVFTDSDGVRRKLVFKPDQALDEAICRVRADIR